MWGRMRKKEKLMRDEEKKESLKIYLKKFLIQILFN